MRRKKWEKKKQLKKVSLGGDASPSNTLGDERSRRPISVSPNASTANDDETQPRKKTRRNVENLLSIALEKQHQLNKHRLELEENREKARLEIEKVNAFNQKAQAQAMYIQALKSIGLSNEDIMQKMTEMWEQ